MTKGAWVSMAILGVSALGGLGMYYAQTRAYYVPVPADDARAQIALQGASGDLALAIRDFDGIDADSSPIRFRACFQLEAGQEAVIEEATPYAGADPLIAPSWFSCFDAPAIGAALEAGQAQAYLGVARRYGIDMVVTLFPDGRGYVWPQINACGEAAFNGDPLPEGCPPAPEGQ